MSLRHTLLGILDWIPAHGYALREMAKGYSWIYPMTNANIYPALRQLENEGFIHHTQEIHDGRLRKIYTITEAGRGELRRWLGDPTEQRGVFRDPSLLKICLLRPGAYGEARTWLEKDLQETLQVCEDADAYMKQNGDRLPKYTRLVAEFGRELAHLRARWTARIVDELGEDADAGSS
ncbi:MAG: PadR family transcriptional regulator [Myxococcota bacterium]